MAKVPDPLDLGGFRRDDGGWNFGQYVPPSDNGLVLWKRMEDRTPDQRAKQHDEWDRNNKKKPD